MDPRHHEAVARFNRGDYFEAHDAWEELWNEAPEAERGFYQGLIQVATALHHMTIGNMRGAKLLHGSAHELLAPYGDFHGGMDLKTLRARFDAALDEILKLPLEALAGRGRPDLFKIPLTAERRFHIELR
jgi:predicted metal-dependent hydrolase